MLIATNFFSLLSTSSTSEPLSCFVPVKQAPVTALRDRLSTVCLAFWLSFQLGSSYVASPECVLMISFILLAIDGRFDLL